jgi:hypothetical protein
MGLLGDIKGKVINTLAWRKRESLFKRFLSRYVGGLKTEQPTGGKVAFVVMPWILSSVPFIVMVMGIFISRRGREVHFIVDTFRYGKSGYFYDLQARTILRIIRIVQPAFTVINPKLLSPVTSDGLSETELNNMAKQCTIHYMRGELLEEGRQQYYDLVLSQLTAAEPYIHAVFKQHKYDYIYFPGGIHGTSCLHHAFSRRYGVRINTFDSDFGVVITSTDGIAAHFSDLPRSFKMVKDEITPHIREAIRQKVKTEIDQRSAGVDHFNTQVVDRDQTGISYEVGCLIILNVSWDSAALNIHGVFGSYAEWLLSTVRNVLEQSNDHVTIRQHPHERFPLTRGTDDFQTLLAKAFNNSERIHFVDAYAKVNTYALINRSKYVVAYSSTSGMEAVVLKKPVIVGARCYYSKLGFVNNAGSKEEYAELMKRGSEGQLLVSDQQQDDAYICYFIAICCNLMFTSFTPVTVDFKKWVVRDGDEILAEKQVQQYLTSIDNNIPLSYLQYRQLLNLN